jgi:hypothetical protein
MSSESKKASAKNWAIELGLDKVPKSELVEVYNYLNTRRLQWDNLLWQVPIISLTGVSFLFTIIFMESTSRFSRTLVCCLTIIISYASLFTLARHRLSEVYDSNLMQGIEEIRYKTSIHGTPYRENRQAFISDGKDGYRKGGKNFWDRIIVFLNKGKAYPIWMTVFTLFILTALTCLFINVYNPTLFS